MAADAILDPPKHVGEERIEGDAQQRVHAYDQHIALFARGHCPQVDAKVLRRVGIEPMEGIIYRKRQGDVRERIELPAEKKAPRGG